MRAQSTPIGKDRVPADTYLMMRRVISAGRVAVEGTEAFDVAKDHGGSAARKAILILSASQYLAGHPISEVIKADWPKDKARDVAGRFDSLEITHSSSNTQGLRSFYMGKTKLNNRNLL